MSLRRKRYTPYVAMPASVEVHRRMSSVEATEIRVAHRPYYHAFKTRVAVDGDFDAILRRSLDALVAQGYCASDIAMMCGVTRQRVEQWTAAYHIPTPTARHGSLLRLWDPDLAHFRPLTRADFKRTVLWRQGRSARDDARSAERRAMVQTVRDLRERLQRDPTIAEVVGAVGRPGTYITRLWTASGVPGSVRPGRFLRGWSRLRRLAGCAVVPVARVAMEPTVRRLHINAYRRQRYRRLAVARPWAADGAEVRRLRKAAGFTQRRVASCLGIGTSNCTGMAQWECGVCRIPPRHWRRLAMILGLPQSEVARCFPRAF